jgi:hypothetical protein
MNSKLETPEPPEKNLVSAEPPLKGQDHEDSALDEALRESFPSSDPIAISIEPLANGQS